MRETLGGGAVGVVLVEPVELFVFAGLCIVIETLGNLDARLNEQLGELGILFADTSLLGSILASLALSKSKFGAQILGLFVASKTIA